MDLSDFTPAERRGILRVQRRHRRIRRQVWWRNFWATLTGN